MSTVRTTVRLVIYGGLLLSLSLTALRPCFAVGLGRKEILSSHGTSQLGQCAAEDGIGCDRNLCAGAHCPRHPFKKDQSQRSSMPADDEVEPRYLDPVASCNVAISSEAVFSTSLVTSNIDPSGNSLVALSIRLNN